MLIEFGGGIGDASHRAVAAATAALRRAANASTLEVVPAYTSIAVHYDPRVFASGSALPDARSSAGSAAIPYDRVCAVIEALLRAHAGTEGPSPRTVEIPVRYGGDDGPDLDDVARRAELDADAVVRLHAGADYTVHMIGFAPGFPYLAGLPPRIATPRRDSPRARVPAGSVGIAGGQTGIYPLATPGGWRLIGRTDVRLFRPDADPPALLAVGDRVRFIPVA